MKDYSLHRITISINELTKISEFAINKKETQNETTYTRNLWVMRQRLSCQAPVLLDHRFANAALCYL